MHLIYFDEVKFEETWHPYYRLAGIVVPHTRVPDLEEKVNVLSAEIFGNRYLTKDTEFHSTDLLSGKANFKHRRIEERLKAWETLLDIIDCDDVLRIDVRIDPARMYASDAIERTETEAFMHIVERSNRLMEKYNSTGLLVRDYEKDVITDTIFSLSYYRQHGTKYQFGTEITHLIDTVHFVHSHHSRMLQLADVYSFARQLQDTPRDNEGWPRTQMRKIAWQTRRIYSLPDTYKHWPND
jgi:hypothetical protein